MKNFYLKKCLSLVICILSCFNIIAQTSVKFKESTQKFESSETFDKVVYIPLNALNVNTTSGVMTLTFSRNDQPLHYVLPANNFIVAPFSSTVQIPFTIKRSIVRKTGDTVTMHFTDIFTQEIRTTNIIILPQPEEKKDNKSDRNRIMLLNAYNFDFGNSSLGSNYVGSLNLFAPSLSNDKVWGFNTGIMKINYGEKDTSNGNGAFIRENVFVGPFDTLGVGLKYLKQINSYKTEVRNTVWSFYVQPTYELTNKENEQHIYAHAHLELLASKITSTTTITTIKQDTGIYSQPSNDFVIRSGIISNNTYRQNYLWGYFGVGFTFDLKPWNGGSFFFQPTLGWTSNQPIQYSRSLDGKVRPTIRNTKSWGQFYLARALYRHTLSKDATVIVGMEIRGLLPTYTPQYSAYIGLNIGLDSILGLIGGKKE